MFSRWAYSTRPGRGRWRWWCTGVASTIKEQQINFTSKHPSFSRERWGHQNSLGSLAVLYCRWSLVKDAGRRIIGLCLTSQWGTISLYGKDRSSKTPSACRSRNAEDGEGRVSYFYNFRCHTWMYVCWPAATRVILARLLARLASAFPSSWQKQDRK